MPNWRSRSGVTPTTSRRLEGLLGVQQAYSAAHHILFTMSGRNVPKSKGEKILGDVAEAVANFREKAPPPAGEGVVTIVQADAKGINMVRPVEKAKGQTKQTDERKETLTAVIGYMDVSKGLMLYGACLQGSYPIGTGLQVGGVRRLFGDRKDSTGYNGRSLARNPCWVLRSVHINWEMANFQEHRIKREQRRINGAA